MDLVKTALYYKSLGLSVVAIGKDKKSIHYWQGYQRYIMNDTVLQQQFARKEAWGVAIVCGKVSGNLEVIDIDEKYALTQNLFKDFICTIDHHDPLLLSMLPIAATRNGGYHLYYRCNEIGKHMLLARRPATQQELALRPNHTIKILIEKLGEADYVIVPPSPEYRFIQHDLDYIPQITPTRRQLLIDIASSFNQYTEPEISIPVSPSVHNGIDSPLNDYDAYGDIIGLLQKHGWTVVKTTPLKTYLRRPGETDHDSSANYHHGFKKFYVFSSSTIFKRCRPYRPSAVFAFLECGGDFKLAAKRLLAQGYGISYKKRNTDY